MTELGAAVLARAERLGLEPLGLALLAADILVLLAVAGSVARRLRVAPPGSPRALLAVGLVALAAVVLPATVLGAAGLLSNASLITAHLLLVAAALAVERAAAGPGALRRLAATPPAVLTALARIPAQLLRRRAWRRGRRGASVLLAGILVVLAFYALLALGTLPLSYDSQTYRLSRVALWLQDGSIAHLATDDDRLNYVGQNADLVMLWLISFFPAAYPLVHAVQYLGGGLACGAAYELAALLGWRRRARLAAVAVLLGIPSVGIQFFTSQTDLFTAGTLAAGVVFALAGVRRRRAGDWLLAGTGAGLALGAKGTALYFVPGLGVLFAAWLVLERCPWRAALRGAALAAVPLVLLASFNFWQNTRSFGNPFAPRPAIEGLHGPGRHPGNKTLRNLVRVGWQLLEPASNPLVPEAIRAPLHGWATREMRERLGRSGGWLRSAAALDGKIDEDHASFGVVVTSAVLAGGLFVAARALRRRRRRAMGEAALFAAVAGFVLFFCWRSTMNVHQFRYFTLIGPFAAVVAVAPFVGPRAAVARVGLALLVAAQLVTAWLVGVRSEYHGWTALLDPSRTPHYAIWRDRRALAETLPESVRELRVVMPFDSWLAPYLRTRPPRRVRLVPHESLAGLSTPGELVAASASQALVVDPRYVLGFRLDDVAALPAPWILRTPQLALVPVAPEARPRPAIVLAQGVYPLGWTAPDAHFELAGWSAPSFELALLNASPLARRIELRSRGAARRLEVAPGAPVRLEIPVVDRDTVSLSVRPPFVPARDSPPTTDARELGLYVEPSRLEAVDGLFGDGWTAPRATLRLVNWVSGSLALELANPTPLARTVRLAGRHGEARLSLAPQSRGRLALDVLPLDVVALEVEPSFVPAAGVAGSTDTRALGVLLDLEALRPPAPGEYR